MDQPSDAPPPMTEADIRAILESARDDIQNGRTQPLGPVIDEIRAVAEVPNS